MAEPYIQAIADAYGPLGLAAVYLGGTMVVGAANYLSADETERDQLHDDIADIHDEQ